MLQKVTESATVHLNVMKTLSREATDLKKKEAMTKPRRVSQVEGLARAEVLGRGAEGKKETGMAEAQNAYEVSPSNTEVGLLFLKPQ